MVKCAPVDWWEAFRVVDRGLFVPARAWWVDQHGEPRPLDRATDPEAWRAVVYADEPVITQFDNGTVAWPRTSRNATSSASQPSMVLIMLDALRVTEGLRVLEIGTGTGYNAALLAHRLGDDNVITVEIDPTLAAQACANLANAGHTPTVVQGDGAAGWAAEAPYDRIIATAAVTAGHVPPAWIAQTRPGGQILLPWGTAYRNGVLVRLTVHGDGTATGPVIGDSAFMRLRTQDFPTGHAARMGELADAAPVTTTTMPPDEIGIDDDGAFAVGLHMPDVQRHIGYDDPEHYEVLLYHVPTESAATAQITPEARTAGRWQVRQHGPRRLWDEAEAAHARWVALGRPARTRFGLNIAPGIENAYLDRPSNVVRTRDWM